VLVYLDGLLVTSKSFVEHTDHLRRVLDRLMEVGLKLKPTNCRVIWLSGPYIVSSNTAQQCKGGGSQELSRPKSSKEVKSFLGLINFYWRHLPNFALVARPLTRQDKAMNRCVLFENVKRQARELLILAPLWRPPDLSNEFFLWTDASSLDFRAVLEQMGEDMCCYPGLCKSFNKHISMPLQNWRLLPLFML